MPSTPPEIEGSRAESIAWMDALIDHLEVRPLEHGHCPAQEFADMFRHELEAAWRPKVRAWSFHWWLGRELRSEFQRHEATSSGGVTCLVHGFEER